MSVLRKAVPITLAVVAGIVNGVYSFEPYLNKDKVAAANKAALPSAESAQGTGQASAAKPDGGGFGKGQAS